LEIIMNTPHTFTAPVAIRNLLADMVGDESNQRLPKAFVGRLTLAMLRLDNGGVAALADETKEAGWFAYVAGEEGDASLQRSAYDYCLVASQILKGI